MIRFLQSLYISTHHTPILLRMTRMIPVKVPNALKGIEEVVVTHTKTKNGTIESKEKVVPIILTKGKRSGQSSKPKPKRSSPANLQLHTPEPERDIPTEVSTQHIEDSQFPAEQDSQFPGDQDYGFPDPVVEPSRPQATVCAGAAYYLSHLTDFSQSPNEQWLQVRTRYLHVLLENKGKPVSDKCSICHGPAMIKCPDCFGSPSYCRGCVSDAHRCSPFHRPLLWTATHYTKVSLQSLGYFLCLGHGGAPCPKTVEVCVY